MKTTTDKSKQPSNTTIQIFKPELFIEKALSLSKETPLNELELAKLAGFNDNEIQMVQMFWKPVFNQSWIYLSDEIILEYLTNTNNKDTITDFYRKTFLKGDYIEEIDYKEVSSENELVKFGSDFFPSQKSKTKSAHNKKYYIITGETYKSLLLTSKSVKGKETRRYFIKTETLAVQMKDYLFAILTRENKRILKLHNLCLL